MLKKIFRSDKWLALIPVILYAVGLAVSVVWISANTSRPGYTEDYSGLWLIVIPFYAFVHYALASVLAAAMMGISKVLGRPMPYIRALWVSLWGVIAVALFVVVVVWPLYSMLKYGHF
jgi:hypothetical protein